MLAAGHEIATGCVLPSNIEMGALTEVACIGWV
jgi:hypothetical protein